LDIGPEPQAESREALDPIGAGPSWQLALAKERAGEIVRALAWAGPERVHAVLKEIEAKVRRTEIQEVAQQVFRLPSWMASAISRSAVDA